MTGFVEKLEQLLLPGGSDMAAQLERRFRAVRPILIFKLHPWWE